MRVFYCDHFELPLPQGHRFPVDKYQLVRERVVRTLAGQIELCVAPAAQRDQLAVVHEKEYLSRVFSGELSVLEQKRIGFPWSEKMLERCRRSTGATIGAAQAALEDQIAVHLSGGTHHAFANAGQGYCVFNDIAVAARLLIQSGSVRRVLVIDLDVHQGNGTAAIFANDPRVFTFSMHGDRNFPFQKTDGDLDIALPDGTEDEAYLSILAETLCHKLPLNEVDFVFYLAGADPFMEDRLGRLKLTKEGLARRDALVLDALAKLELPAAIVLGGGYASIQDVAEIHAHTVQLAAQHYRRFQTC